MAAVLLAACTGDSQPRYGMPTPVTKQSHSILHLWQGVMVTAIVVGAIVWALILWSVFRYRKRPSDTGLPPQVEYHVPLEVTYTVIPVIIVAVIFFFVVKVENRVNSTKGTPAVTVQVEGFQWGWRFSYLAPDGSPLGTPVVGNQDQPPTLRLPAGETVRLILVADDVAHSFYVPEFLFKRDLIPKVKNVVDLYIDRTGTFVGHCAEFCGLHHADMNFTVEAVPKAGFTPGGPTGGGA